ncbi:3-phenylpropionate/cinnamic acid dioxygenase small subunit [Polaromonas sp. CG_9.5]|uniref:nuclear transport factor 2 family protein n=1 Tax=Polaromonas sp. CG_9.5 TaxID=3071705 RepID=UPI002E0D0B53|nr:3-phenylpropionate/cinnamic acid dioxygenase small subunit [Polaromonas sp. CG_9.5]
MNAVRLTYPVQALPLERLLLERELHQVLIAYALLCDGRDWGGMGNVFSDDASATYGGRALLDRPAILDMLRNHLGGCGPTQHLLGNLQVWVEGEQVTSRIEVRASHRGMGEKKELTYDCMGYYQDRWTRTPGGWRIAHRAMTVTLEFGSRQVLGPAR